MYRITLDPARDIVEVELEGMLSTTEAAAYIDELRHLIVTRHLRSYAMVIDVSRCPIQSQDMVRAMGTHIAAMPKARALAIVTGSSLARMRVRRLFTQPYARITDTLAEGRAWVTDGTEPAAA